MRELSFVIHKEKSVLTPSQTIAFLGNIVASFPAVTYGPLYYTHLEREKIAGLKYHKGKLSAKVEIQWWINKINYSCHHINIPNPDITIYSPVNWRWHTANSDVNGEANCYFTILCQQNFAHAKYFFIIGKNLITKIRSTWTFIFTFNTIYS